MIWEFGLLPRPLRLKEDTYFKYYINVEKTSINLSSHLTSNLYC
jgi:hypothetical protein